MIKQRIMYVCSECAEGCPEACGHYDRTELRVMPDGAWLCESCFDNNDDNEFLSWGHLPAPEEYGRIPASAQDAPDADIDKLRSVFEAAYGLCHGYDWNNGTAAKACGYRRKLLSAVNAIRPVPDFEGKYASPMTEGEPPSLKRRSEADAYYKILQTIARFPITDPKNQDAVNLQLIAKGALELSSTQSLRQEG
ncbi:hypothetical protein [Bradyrhizobium elkanii]|uniref:hypothetical protein n=1 Tax=Bradyrhizobium elkanii TaxID=29448 RepID=UPI003512472F